MKEGNDVKSVEIVFAQGYNYGHGGCCVQKHGPRGRLTTHLTSRL